MSMLDNRAKATIGTAILTGIFILLEHYNGGVVSHYLLAREDLPKISNWWGLLTIPILTWIVFSLRKGRSHTLSPSGQTLNTDSGNCKTKFLAALVFGVVVSALWEFGLENVLQYVILTPFLIAVFKAVHYPEVLLGFVVGMIYTFGGILPIIIGLVLLITCYIINKLFQMFKTLLASISNRT